MPKVSRRGVPADDPEYRYTSWIEGYNTTQPRNKISRQAMSNALNVEINLNSVKKRMGTAYLGNAKDARTRGLAVYTHTDGTKKIIRSSGTTLQVYNPSTGDFDNQTGKTYTSDLNTDYLLAYDDLYIFNGTDNLTKYNKNDSPVITTYTEVTAPTGASAARGGGLSSGAYTAYFKLSHYNDVGETIATSEFSVSINIRPADWNAATEKVTVTWTDGTGGTIVGTNIFYSSTAGDETYLDTVEGSGVETYDFTGGALVADGLTEPPETNSTGGVIGYAGTYDGTRLWVFSGSTLYYSGGGSTDIDHFDSSSGGGALSISKGDGDEIKKVLKTRDGAILVYKEFSIWKVYFNDSGIITLRNVNQFIGCVGRRAAVSVDDDQVFMSRFGIFTAGNQPNFPTDIIRVKSMSFPIDDDLSKISPTNLPNVVLHYDFKRRLRVAYAEGSSTYNNREFIFKYGAWVPNDGIAANCYINFTDVPTGTPIISENSKAHTLYGDDNAGRVVQIDKGYSDRGSAINAFFETNQDDQGKPERLKKYYDQDVEIGRLQGALDIYQYFDSGTDIHVQIPDNTSGGVGSEAIGLSEVGAEYGTIQSGSADIINKRWRLYGREQKYIRTRFEQNSASGTFEIMSFSGVYREKSRRQYDSDDILTTSEV